MITEIIISVGSLAALILWLLNYIYSDKAKIRSIAKAIDAKNKELNNVTTKIIFIKKHPYNEFGIAAFESKRLLLLREIASLRLQYESLSGHVYNG
jgi:hypothetical protein